MLDEGVTTAVPLGKGTTVDDGAPVETATGVVAPTVGDPITNADPPTTSP